MGRETHWPADSARSPACATRKVLRSECNSVTMTMTAYTSMTCRLCQATVHPDLAIPAKAPKSPAECMYRCTCGVAYSNAVDVAKRTLIWATPEQNVPTQVVAGLADALDHAVNLRNRRPKRWHFRFETSEDAVTWTVVRGLADLGRLGAVRPDGSVADTPAVLLWGAPTQGGATGHAVASELADVSADLREKASARSEPDVILVWPDLLILIEAKYRSPNTRQKSPNGFPLYLDLPDLFAVDVESVAKAAFYELTRNWRIGSELGSRLGRDMLLLNIAREEARDSATQFSKLLEQSSSRSFGFLTWADVLGRAADAGPRPGWLGKYADARGLRASRG